jgi:hypothetical protein
VARLGRTRHVAVRLAVLATQVDGEPGAAEQHAARLLARCEGAATPPVRTLTGRVRLTPGELDSALQAAAGDLYLGADRRTRA